MTRSLYVEDLAPGDRITVDGINRVVRTAGIRRPDDSIVIEVVKGPDDISEIVLAQGSKVEVL